MGLFYPAQKMYGLKIYRAVMYHDNEKSCKISRELNFRFKTDMRNLTHFDRSTHKFQKFTL